MPAVAERAQEELHVVVSVDLVAVGERGLHALGPGLRPYAEIQGGRRVPDEDLGLARGLAAIDGGVAREAAQPRGLLPDRLVERPVELDVGLDPRRPDAETAREPGEDIGGDGRRGSWACSCSPGCSPP